MSGAVCVLQARLSADDSLLIAPHGLMFDEVTASSLVKVNKQGVVTDSGSTAFSVNGEAVALHAAVYSASNSTKCVVHIASPAVLSVLTSLLVARPSLTYCVKCRCCSGGLDT